LDALPPNCRQTAAKLPQNCRQTAAPKKRRQLTMDVALEGSLMRRMRRPPPSVT
jgi:hypothetical protein